MIRRILFAVMVVGLVFGSLITFPEYVPWMVLVWVGWGLWRVSRRRAAWPWLLGVVAIVTLKRPGFTLEFFLLIGVMFLVAVVDWLARRQSNSTLRADSEVDGEREATRNRVRLAVYAFSLLGIVFVYGGIRWFATNTSHRAELDQRPIACLGDSLTDFGYPQKLAERLSVPIADFGVNGITTDDGLNMVPEILAADPQLIVIELGGHDYNGDKKTRAATRKNLVKLIESFLDRGILVVLVEIPRGFIYDPYDGLERELAAAYDLQMIDDSLIRGLIFNSPILPPGAWRQPDQRYSEDGLHPNDLGNEYFADRVSQALVKVFGASVLKREMP